MSYYGTRMTSGVDFRGDPGFLSALGKIGKGILGIGATVMPGGGIVTKALQVGSALTKSKAGTLVKSGTAIVKAHPALTAAAAAATVGTVGAGVAMSGAPRPAVHGMMGGGRALRINPRTGLPVRHRRMRATNVKALHRAIRRCSAFEKLAKRVLHISSPHKAHVFKGFKKRRRAK